MNSITRVITAVASTVLVSACQKQTASCPNEPTVAPPTATEVFHLRNECTELGRKIMEGNFIGIALTQTAESHYNPKTNRCYVKLEVSKANLNDPHYVSHTYLYDGQTQQILAYTSVDGDKMYGIVYVDTGRQIKSSEDLFDDANKYIIDMMADDRQQ